MSLRPLIGIPADARIIAAHPSHVVGDKYARAVLTAAQGLPLLIPAMGDDLDLQDLLQRVDGLLLTGSPSNVMPYRYQGQSSEPGTLHDEARDATTLPLILAALSIGMPVLGICRGFQEMNVAFGGSLHQKVHEVAGKMNHREDTTRELDVQYGPAHEVFLTPGGTLHRLAGRDRIAVNSLHSQGVDRLGVGLTIEATAPDGLIEAFRVTDATGFALAVQWHPEWKVLDNPFSSALFKLFGDAARDFARTRPCTFAKQLPT